jgi:hypothetical protein
MTARSIGVRCLATIVVSTCAMAALSSPALALTYGFAPWLVCYNNTEGAEVVAREMGLEPANGATVPPGTPVTFSGESSRALTFNVASSPAQLPSPDIDSGTGSQSGASYRFTSTNATATPRTIYWTASFTFTPGDCESPSTFTTPVHTLIVAPTAAELAAAKARQEEEAAKKRLEEEAAAKKKAEEAAAAGSVVLDGITIDVENRHQATVKLTCSDVATCAGKLTLTANATASKSRARHPKTDRLGTAGFSIAASTAATVKIMLDSTGRALLSAAHGHLNATLTILRTSPPPNKTQSQHVQLDLKTAKAK